MKRRTNVQFVKHSMEHSEYGALKQAYIIAALDTYTRQVLSDQVESPMSGIVAPDTWQKIAMELQKELLSQYGERS